MVKSRKRIKQVLSLLLAVLMLTGTMELGFGGFTAFAEGGKTIYVSTTGSRSGDGSASNPFASVAAAIAAAADGDTIEVAGGTYYLDEAISFSGKSNITVRSASGQTAVFSGGYNVTGWTSATLNEQNCLAADIPYDIYNEIIGDNGGNAANGGVFTLYNAAGDMLVNSRFPDTGYRYATAGSGATFTGEAEDVSWLSDEVLDKAIVRVDHKWISETSKISGFNASTNQVTLASYGIGCAVGDNYYFENVKHGFDKAGEWYFDYAACRVYYIPKTGETASNVNLILGKEQRLAEITGSSNIKFQNIKFENSNWGYRGYRSQSAIDSVACIRVKNSSGVEFTGCTFSNIGNTAISFGDNASDGRCTGCKVTGCKFTNIGNNAIFVGAGSETSNRCENIEISDNLISGYGKMYHHAAAILATKVYNCNIHNNEIHDGNYTAISVGWNWGFMATVTDYNKVNNNLIYNIGHSALCDMGGIYFLGIQQNSEIKNNVVFGVEHFSSATTEGAWGIYLDEGSSGVDVMNNIVHDCGGEGFHQHYGYNNVLSNNIFAFNRASQVRSTADKTPSTDSAITGISGQQADVSLAEGDDAAKKYYHDTTHGYQFTLTNNILVADNGYMYGSFRNASQFSDNNNTYYDYTRAEVLSSGTLTTKSQITGSGLTNDYSGGKFQKPNFTNAANRDFSFSGSAPSGFTAISTANVGSSTYGSAARYNAVKLKTLNEDYYYEGAEYDAYKAACLTSNASTIVSAYNALDNANYTITLNANGGTCSETSKTYNGISTVTLPAATKSGYTFKGWQRADGAIYPQGTYYAGSGSYTMTAVYEVRPAEITSTGSHKFVYFDNIAKLADITVPNTGINVSNVKVDYATNSISFTATGSDCYVQAFDIPGIVTNHNYIIYYDLYVDGARTSNTRMTLNAYNWKTRYLEDWANGQEFQAQEGRLELRPGINNNTGRNVTVEYRNIRIMDVAWGGNHDRIPCEEVVRAVPNGSAIGAMPEEPCSGLNFIGWGDEYNNPANGINGTEYTASTVPTKNVILYPGYGFIKAEDASMKVAVPETIYLNPSNSKDFQYFVNNTITDAGVVSLDKSSTATTGNYYFYCPGVSGNVTVKLYDGSSERYSGTITLSNGYGHGSIGQSQSLNAAITASTSKELKWVFTYDGGSVTAYTTAYAPYANPVGAAVIGVDRRNKKDAVQLSGFSYWAGVHSVGSLGSSTALESSSGDNDTSYGSSTGEYYHKLKSQDSANYIEPLTNGVTTKSGNNYASDWLTTTAGTGVGSSKTMHLVKYYKNDGNNRWVTVQSTGYTAKIAVDSSRYSDLNQIPNLKVGTVLTRAEYAQNIHSYYICETNTAYNGACATANSHSDDIKHGIFTTSGKTEIVGSTTNGNLSKSYGTDSEGWIRGNATNRGEPYSKAITKNYEGNISFFYEVNFESSYDNGWTQRIGYLCCGTFCPIVVACISKENLRDKVAEAISCGLAANDPTNTAYVNACYYLGKPDATAAEISSALTALTTAVSSYGTLGATCTATVNYYKADTTDKVATTETKNFTSPSNVTAFAKEVEGYTLTSCTVNDAAASIIDNKYVVAKKQTAKVTFNYYYTPIKYKVRLMNGSELVSEMNAGYKARLAAVTLPTAPTKPGCKFIGWNTEYGLINSSNETLITKDITAYAVFEPVEYSIYYNVNHDSSKDNYLESPVFLTGSSSGVTCSYNSSDETVTFNGTLTGNSADFIEFPVNASQMTAGTYTIALEEISGERYEKGYGYSIGGGDHSIEVRNGCIVFEFLTKDGKRFGNTGATRVYVDFFGNPVVTKDINLSQDQIDNLGYVSVWMTANGSPNLKLTNYKFKVNLQQQSTTAIASPSSQRIMYNEVPGANNVPTPQRTGYTFGGWYTDAECENENAWNADVAYTTEGNTTLYAKWTPKNYTITYTGIDGATFTPTYTSYTIESNTITLNNPTKAGYRFTGWTLTVADGGKFASGSSTSGTTATIAKGTYGNITATASWVKTWTVTFNANGHGTAPASKSVDNNTVVSDPGNLTATGYTFGGWYKEAACTNAWNFSTDKVTADTTLYAKWTPIKYTVTFNANGHGTAPASQSVDYNTAAAKPTDPTAAGYNFGGWYKEAACTNEWSFTNDKVTGATILYAKWTPKSYTITYTGIDGAVFTPTYTSYTIESNTFTLNNPEKDGYSFIGWTENSTDTPSVSASVANGNYGSKTFTAHWIKNSNALNSTESENILEGTGLTVTGVSANKSNPGEAAKLNVTASGTSLSYKPVDTTWTMPAAFDVTLSNGITVPMTIYPQTNVLYNERLDDNTTIGTFGYQKGTTGAWNWTKVTNTGASSTGSSVSSKVYGYSAANANTNTYSDGTAMQTTVHAGDTDFPTYQFEFYGTGVDLIAMCDDDSGLVTINLEQEQSNGTYKRVGMKSAVNTHFTGGTMYQEVVYHKEGLAYGHYRLTATVSYNKAFDLTEENLAQAGFNTVIPENGSIVDLSDVLGEEYSECEYFCIDSESYRSGNNEIIDFEPVIVGAANPVGDAEEGDYNVTIDGVRVYNPGKQEDGELIDEIAAQYTDDNELNPTYIELKSVFDELKTQDSTLFIEGGTAGWTDYKSVGSNTEINITKGNAISFGLGDFDGGRLHISFRAPKGLDDKVIANVNGTSIIISSVSEQYYDITDLINYDTSDGKGVVTIACEGDDDALLAVCSLKYFEAPGFKMMQTPAALRNAQVLLASMVQPEAEDMTFTVDFGAAGSTTTAVSADKFTVEKVDGVWTATAKLSADDVKALFAKTENSDKYMLNSEDGITLTATYENETWVPQTAKIAVTVCITAKLVAKTGSTTVIEDQLVYGLKIFLTKAEFENSFVSVDGDATIEYSSNGKYLGTGSKVYLVNGDICVAEYTVVIFGDTNGDGIYDSRDAVIANCVAAGVMTVNDEVYMAADCNHDGVVDNIDVNLLDQAGTFLAGVDQTKSEEELLTTSSAYVEYVNLIQQSPETEKTVEEVVEDTPTADEKEPVQINWFEKLVSAIVSFFRLVIEKIGLVFNF